MERVLRGSFFSKNFNRSSDVLRRDSSGDRVFDSNTRISAGTSILEFFEPSKPWLVMLMMMRFGVHL